MSALQFVSEVVGHLAWSVMVGFAAFLFKAPISAVIQSLRRVTYKRGEGFAADFGPMLEALVQDIPRDHAATEPRLDEAIIELSDTNPRGVVIQSWIAVEQAIVRLARERGGPSGRSVTRLKRTLLETGVLDARLNGMLEDLRVLRNEAAHSPDLVLTPEEAREYALAAANVVIALEMDAGVPASIDSDAPPRVEPLSATRITVTVQDDGGARVGAVPSSVVKVEGDGRVDDVPGGYTFDGRGAFTYLAPLTPGEAVFLIRAGDAAKGQQIRSAVTIAVGV